MGNLRRYWWLRGSVALFIGAALAVGASLLRPAAAAPQNCGYFWQTASSANAGAGNNHLTDIFDVTVNDVWAVGYYANGNTDQTLVEHWDGNSWAVVPSPNVGAGANYLLAVTAVAANDVWAVGYYYNGTTNRNLTEHWNGSSWAVVPSPGANQTENEFYAVAAVATNDVWAVGFARNASNVKWTLTEHWDGTSWAIVTSANHGTLTNVLTSVAVVASNDVWAVGSYTTLTLIEHWNGSSWTVVPSPNVGSGANYLQRVAVVGSNDVWAVGYYWTGSTFVTLTMHWNGVNWVYVVSPNIGSGQNTFSGLSAQGSSDVWASGGYWIGGVEQTLTEHWDGASWSVVPSVNVGSGNNVLSSVLNQGIGRVWAAGTYNNGSTAQTLIEYYSFGCFTPSPTPTPPPASPTPTPPATAPPTNTAGPSPTPCALSFTDVHPTDYFYAPVLYLACHGVISGYGDGTFRPYNNTTRSQMVKIVVLGFGKPITTPPGGAYTFADVPPSNPFFAVVETAAAGQIVSGYACGGAGEPCDSLNRPYFRPAANVTRGQLAKIVVAAAGWPLQNPAAGTFADVLPGSAFYPFVETAYCHGIISGYACGGAGEPCDAINRPYFRQGNQATRGQIAKIVDLAVTAGAACGP
ncbi:MAG TPA: S-layer homology domain-containing protein [Chloroflexia bacterium]|nr:S-layer homology domain-containing protein [Chloroflexia bacterium]